MIMGPEGSGQEVTVFVNIAWDTDSIDTGALSAEDVAALYGLGVITMYGGSIGVGALDALQASHAKGTLGRKIPLLLTAEDGSVLRVNYDPRMSLSAQVTAALASSDRDIATVAIRPSQSQEARRDKRRAHASHLAGKFLVVTGTGKTVKTNSRGQVRLSRGGHAKIKDADKDLRSRKDGSVWVRTRYVDRLGRSIWRKVG